jgi:hypothetical protein
MCCLSGLSYNSGGGDDYGAMVERWLERENGRNSGGGGGGGGKSAPGTLRPPWISHEDTWYWTIDSVLKSQRLTAREYCNVLSPFLGENEIKHSCVSPYCVALSPHASTGYISLVSVRFVNVFCSKSHLNCSRFLNSRHSFPKKSAVDGHTAFQY